MRMEGKVAIVTGGARGIGEAIARLFAKEGACVTIGDILVDQGRKVTGEIVDAGRRALFVALDVTKEEDWRAAIEATVNEFGKLNVLVNNAGIYSPEIVARDQPRRPGRSRWRYMPPGPSSGPSCLYRR